MTAFDPSTMGDKALMAFLIELDRRARHVQKLPEFEIKNGDTVLVARNMPEMRHAALHRYHLPDDYWSAYAEAQKRELI